MSKLEQCAHRVQELQKRADTFKKTSENVNTRMHQFQEQEQKASADAARIASECATERELQATLCREVAENQMLLQPEHTKLSWVPLRILILSSLRLSSLNTLA